MKVANVNEGREVHQVLMSRSLVGGLSAKSISHPNANIVVVYPNEVERLTQYDLVILPYSEFERTEGGDRSADPHKEIFEKQMLEALEAGKVFCFAHHDEDIPGPLRDYAKTGYESDEAAHLCYRLQAGFPWLLRSHIRIGRSGQMLLQSEVRRGEFSSFLQKWGASYHYFRTFEEAKFDEVICTAPGNDDLATGFAINFRRGLIVYLPLQINHSQAEDFRNSLISLVDSLLTYQAKKARELPAWAKEPLFEKEKVLHRKKASLLADLEKTDTDMAPYEEAKALLVASECTLETALPKFITDRVGLRTHRDEKYAEDFWLLGSDAKKLAVCEIKSVTKGFKKGAIYDVYNHREKNGLPESFPAVLFANCNLQAGSWAKKEAAIQESDCRIAVENNVLIVRVEDLVRIWEAKGNGALTTSDVLRMLTTAKGWLECKSGKMIVHS
jgi:hypothetical protein